jgi:signal transduction histidine kinase
MHDASELQCVIRHKVLLVDDDEDAYVLTHDLFEEFIEPVYELDWIRDYDTALLEMARNAHSAYLIDFYLGGYNGLELIADARIKGCTGAIILLTGLESHHVDKNAMNVGTSDYLVKGDLTARVLERSLRYAIQHGRDLDALRHSAAELRLLNDQLRASEQELRDLNAGKDAFVSVLAHDLRTPFVGLLGFSELLDTEFEKMYQEDIRLGLHNLHLSARSMFQLLEKLLRWGQVQSGRLELHPEHLDARTIAEQVVELFSSNARQKQISLLNRIPAMSVVHADAMVVSTVLENLVGNAIKFTPEHGTVMISAECTREGFTIAVQDSGVGMSESQRASLFQLGKHKSTYGTNSESGSGLGLLICKDLMKKCGGTIHVESTEKIGTSVHVSFPSETASVAEGRRVLDETADAQRLAIALRKEPQIS